MNKTSKYSEAIKSKNLANVFKIFNEELKSFIEQEHSIYNQWLAVDEKNQQLNNHLRFMYCQTFENFTKQVPFQVLTTYIGENKEETLRLSDITNSDMLDGYDKKLNTEVADLIVRYTTYFHLKNNRLYRECILWQSLVLTAKMIDLTSMSVRPEDVVKVVDDVLTEIHNGLFSKPNATTYQGHIHPNKLSSSAKVGLYRMNKMQEWLESYILDYRKNFNKVPSRSEAKDYLVECCKQTKDNKLWLFRSGLNSKTFRKFTDGYTLLDKRPRHINNSTLITS